jgi:transposase
MRRGSEAWIARRCATGSIASIRPAPTACLTLGRADRRRASPSQKAELAAIVEAGPDRKIDGVVRWRRIDLQRVIGERFGVAYHERYVGTLLQQLGFSHMSARPRHPGQNAEIIEAFKKTSHAR